MHEWLLMVISGCSSAVALNLIGHHIAARNRSVQTLCISQGAVVGSSIAVNAGALTSPLAYSLLGSFIAFSLGQVLGGRKIHIRNSLHVGLFAFLISITFVISSYWTEGEHQFTDAFFESLTSLSSMEQAFVLFGAMSIQVFIYFFHDQILNDSFELSCLGNGAHYSRRRRLTFVFALFHFLTISFSVYYLGLLFTLLFLFLPLSICSLLQLETFKGAIVHSSLLAVVGTLTAFIVQDQFLTNHNPIPLMGLTLLGCGVVWIFLHRLNWLQKRIRN